MGSDINVMIDQAVIGTQANYSLHADVLDHYMHDMSCVLLLPLYSVVKIYLMSRIEGKVN